MTASIDESKVQAAAKQYCLLLGIDPYEHVTRQVPDYDNLMVLRYEPSPTGNGSTSMCGISSCSNWPKNYHNKEYHMSDEAVVKHIWLVIESAKSVPEVDSKNAFQKDEQGNMLYCPDEKDWQPLIAEDIPEWVKQSHVIQALTEGLAMNQGPANGGRWYRARISAPPATTQVVH